MSQVSVALLYPAEAAFDHDQCREHYLPLLRARLGRHGLLSAEAHRGLAGDAPGRPPPFACIIILRFPSLETWRAAFAAELEAILADLPDLTSAEPLIQISDVS